MLRKLDLYLRKIQISFLFEKKFRSASNKNAGLFFIKKKIQIYIQERFKSVLDEEKFRSTSKKDANLFLF